MCPHIIVPMGITTPTGPVFTTPTWIDCTDSENPEGTMTEWLIVTARVSKHSHASAVEDLRSHYSLSQLRHGRSNEEEETKNFSTQHLFRGIRISIIGRSERYLQADVTQDLTKRVRHYRCRLKVTRLTLVQNKTHNSKKKRR